MAPEATEKPVQGQNGFGGFVTPHAIQIALYGLCGGILDGSEGEGE